MHGRLTVDGNVRSQSTPGPFRRPRSSPGQARGARSGSSAIVSETLTIALRRRPSLEGNNQLFVRCSELDCQYIDANELPYPLTLDLFADEVRERQRRREESL